ncbi:MAG TPA: dTDP-4-amino-4,6-dideoxygalactose transaminase [Solirubrobacter sp.]
MDAIPFNRPRLVGSEHRYIDEALASGKLSGNGTFARRCAAWIQDRFDVSAAMITPSCTSALEMTCVVAELRPGDEVIVPDFTFVSTANAFALRGVVPVFVDIDPDTLNIDPDAIEGAITERTRAIVVVHYGGVACDMDRIMAVAERHGLIVIEDAAHAIEATYRGRPLGSFGAMATLSFHETKNVQCGEGGALLLKDPGLVERAEIVQEKGTNRSRFFRGEIDKYTWLDIGSSYLLSEVATAFLWAQLEAVDEITRERRGIWQRYYDALAPLEEQGVLRRPIVPAGSEHGGHLFHVLVGAASERDPVIAELRARGVHAVFHYLPLHASPGGRRFGRLAGSASVTEDASARLIRLPLWSGMGEARVERVIEAVYDSVGVRAPLRAA